MTAIRPFICAAASGLVIAAGMSPAEAHVQVRPATAAPDDAVLWEVLVPNERSSLTTRVELAIPPGVIPFSYLDAPGWRRSLTRNKDGSTRSIVWRGRLRRDGFASFEFLASTPPQQGEIAWKAIQTYEDGKKQHWIGTQESDTPAALTTVSKSFARQNAGGEGTGQGDPQAAPAGPASTAGEDSSDGTARWLAGAALAAALAALAVSMLRLRQARRS